MPALSDLGKGSWTNPWGGPATASSPVPNPAYQSASAPVTGMSLPSLANLINSINQIGQTNANYGRIPNAPALEKQSSGNIQSELAGNVDPSTIRLMQQQAAERGVATGVGPTSPNSNASYLQALGLTSQQLQQQGQRDLSAADARNPAAPIFDPMSQLLTPGQSQQLGQSATNAANNNALAWARLNSGGGSGGGGGYSGGSTGITAPAAGTPDLAWNMFGPMIGANSGPIPGETTTATGTYPGVPSDLQPASGASGVVATPTGDYTDPYASLSDTFGPDLSSLYSG